MAGEDARSALRTYLGFLGLTILNPMTVAYFAALVLGLPAVQGGAAERIAFALGAFAASASWQLLLAGAGGLMHRHASPRTIRDEHRRQSSCWASRRSSLGLLAA
jgi:arginine exporter protein ArgO